MTGGGPIILAIRCVVRPGLLIQGSILQGLVPEMVPLSVLQHQIAKFRIKHGKFHKESIHIPSIFVSLSAANEEFHYNARIAEKLLSLMLNQIQTKLCKISIHSR